MSKPLVSHLKKTQKETEQHQYLSQNHDVTHVGAHGTLILSQLMISASFDRSHLHQHVNLKVLQEASRLKQELDCAI